MESKEEVKEKIEPLPEETKGKKKSRPNFPQETVEILMGWLTTHLKNPYPTYYERVELCN